MLKEIYSSIPSFPDDRFLTNNTLNQTVVQTLRDPICQNIPNIFCRESPAECKSCSQIYCSHCIQTIIQNDAKCPKCNEYLAVRKTNRYLRVIISKMSMRCHFQADGCPEAHPFEALIDHEQNCGYVSVKCPNECGELILKKFLKEHTDYECPKELTKCKYQYCTLKLPKEQIIEHEPLCEHRFGSAVVEDHENQEEKKFEAYIEKLSTRNKISENGLDKRPFFKNSAITGLSSNKEKHPYFLRSRKCPNPGCDFIAVEDEIETHDLTCSFRVYPCKNFSKGCDYQGTKSALIAHESKCEFGVYLKKTELSIRNPIFSKEREYSRREGSYRVSRYGELGRFNENPTTYYRETENYNREARNGKISEEWESRPNNREHFKRYALEPEAYYLSSDSYQPAGNRGHRRQGSNSNYFENRNQEKLVSSASILNQFFVENKTFQK